MTSDYKRAPAPAADGEEMMTAIEEFLARTNEYSQERAGRRDGDLGATGSRDASGRETGSREPAPMHVATHIAGTGESGRDASGNANPNDPTAVSIAIPHSEAVTNTGVEIVVPQDPPGPARPVVESMTIRTANSAVPPSKHAEPSRTTNQSLAMASPDERFTVEEMLQRLEADAREHGGFERWWRLQLVALGSGRDAPATTGANDLPVEASRVLDSVASTLKAIHRVVADGALSGYDAWASARELTAILADRADPVVPTVALCRRVVTYGVYDELPPEELIAGRATQAIIYTEVGNLKAEQIEAARFRTVLGTRLELLTASGESLWEHEESEIIDVCRRRRSDFFIAQRVTLPANLAAGDYVLKVLVDDKLSGKANEATLPLTFVAPASLARAGS